MFSKINWRKFLKLVLPVPIILSFIMLLSNKPEWWIVIIITILWVFMLLLSEHSNYIIRVKPILSLIETRKLKLIKLKRKSKNDRKKYK
jgi:hypothetical protein